jgi:dienelactone hydrolase
MALLLAFASALIPISSRAVQIYDRFPDTIHADERYVIYSHGLIVEGDDPRPISPKYGQYEFPAIKQAIFSGGGFNLIAFQRPKSADDAYADTLKSWVRRLLDAGVKRTRITLVGFSRGAGLTALASSGLVSERINTAIMAICENGDVAQTPSLTLGGNLLSIYETSDELGPCTKLAARSHLTSFKEVAISTGKKHGAFFQPLPQWVKPLRAWIAETNR